MINIGSCLEIIRQEIEPLIISELGTVKFPDNDTEELGFFTLPHHVYKDNYPPQGTIFNGIVAVLKVYKIESTNHLGTGVKSGDPTARGTFALICYSYNNQELMTIFESLRLNLHNIKDIKILPEDIEDPNKPDRLVCLLMYDLYDD